MTGKTLRMTKSKKPRLALRRERMSAPFKRADKNARLRCAKNAVTTKLLPHTTDIDIVRLIEAEHVAVAEKHEPCVVCTADAGRRRPEVIAWHVGEI